MVKLTFIYSEGQFLLWLYFLNCTLTVSIFDDTFNNVDVTTDGYASDVLNEMKTLFIRKGCMDMGRNGPSLKELSVTELAVKGIL